GNRKRTTIGADRRDLVENAELVQVLPDEFQAGHGLRMRQVMLGRSRQQRTGDSGWRGVMVKLTFLQDMPDDDQNFASNGGDSLGFGIDPLPGRATIAALLFTVFEEPSTTAIFMKIELVLHTRIGC